MLPLRLRLLRLIPRQARNNPTNRTPNAILHPAAQILHLALSLLALALSVLLDTFLLQPLGADEPADALLQRADVLVPRAGGAVGVVLGDAAGCGGGEGASFGGGVGEIFLGGGFELAVLALGLGDKVSGLGWEEVGRGGWERTLSAVLPVSEPRALCAAPLAWSR
jgi:hypothetical protein